VRAIVKPGEVVEGRYKVIKPIAEGGMGTVFLAEHWLIKRRVALKFLHQELAADATAIRRFMNEALAAGTLGHPNIVESTDMGFVRDVPYIVYEYVDGELLANEIAKLGKLPIARTLKIAWQIASALDAAHEAGIVHRDLKSDNVFLVGDQVKVIDFGISRFLEATDKTAAGANLIGTPEFMAPEQVTAPDKIDKRVDIYALGVLVFEMLCGTVPFVLERRPNAPQPDIEAAHALLARIIHEPPPPLDCEGAPIGLGEMVREKLLAKDPANRYASMKDVQGALEAFAGVLPSGRVTIVPRAKTPVPIEKELGDSKLEPIAIAREVKALGKRWTHSGSDLYCDIYSDHMTKLAAAISAIAVIADDLARHPLLGLRVPHLRITIRNAERVNDLVLAARIEEWFRSNGW